MLQEEGFKHFFIIRYDEMEGVVLRSDDFTLAKLQKDDEYSICFAVEANGVAILGKGIVDMLDGGDMLDLANGLEERIGSFEFNLLTSIFPTLTKLSSLPEIFKLSDKIIGSEILYPI